MRQRVRRLPKGNTLYTPGASPARQAAERRSAKPLIFLHQLPTWIAPLVLVALLIRISEEGSSTPAELRSGVSQPGERAFTRAN